MAKKYPLANVILVALDIFALMLAVFISFFLRYKTTLFGPITHFHWPKFFIYCLLLIPFFIIFKINNLYRQRIFLSGFAQFVQLMKSLIALTAIYVIVVFLSRDLVRHSRSLIGFIFIFSGLLLVLGRIVIFRNLYHKIKHNGILKRRIIVIGAGEAGKELVAKIKENPQENIEIICFFDDDPEMTGKKIFGIPILGTTDDLELYLKKLKIAIDGIYICISFISYENLISLISKCRRFGYPIYLNSEQFKVISDRVKVHEFDSLLSPTVYGGSSSFYAKILKRAIDIGFSVILLIIFSPVLLIVSLLVKITSKGSVFYKARVVGKNEREFSWRKFRTMKINQDESEHKKFMAEMIKKKKRKGALKIQDDPRLTKIGKFLRKFSIDELPQLINVLKGQMSLVGPRPCSPYEYSLYEEWQKKRFDVAPGMTGLWQAFGRSNVSYDDMVIMDLYYIENISFWFDLKILLQTIPVVLFGKGGY